MSLQTNVDTIFSAINAPKAKPLLDAAIVIMKFGSTFVATASYYNGANAFISMDWRGEGQTVEEAVSLLLAAVPEDVMRSIPVVKTEIWDDADQEFPGQYDNNLSPAKFM